jgi:hypothetical protein
MAGAGTETKNIINAFVAVLVGIMLVPVIYQTATFANIAGNTALVLAIIPLLFVLGVLLVTVRQMM